MRLKTIQCRKLPVPPRDRARVTLCGLAFGLTLGLGLGLGPGAAGGPLGVHAQAASDWPNYRGLNHDGIAPHPVRLDWTQRPLARLWRVTLGPALSSFSVSEGRVFTQVRRRLSGVDREVCVALNAETGAELWAASLDTADYPHGGVGNDDGPRSTPTVDGDRVYVFTSYLKLYCLDASSGAVVWRRDFVEEFSSTVIPWQNAASPVVLGELVLVNCNASNRRLLAVSKTDGTTRWQGQNDRMTQATPIVATLAGVPQVVFFAQTGLVSVRPDTGQVLWRFAFPYSTSTAASPVAGEGIVYCSAAYGSGAGAVRVTPSGTSVVATKLWQTPGEHMNHWATPVVHQGYLYGVYGQSLLTLRCVDLATGTERWRQSGVGYGSVLGASAHLLVLTESGQLVLVEPSPDAYRERARFQAVSGKCWNSGAISQGRIYLRSTTEAVAYDARVPVVAKPLALQPSLVPGENALELTLANADGTPIEAARTSRIAVQAASAAASAGFDWAPVARDPVLTNGQLRLREPLQPVPVRVYRAVEQP